MKNKKDIKKYIGILKDNKTDFDKLRKENDKYNEQNETEDGDTKQD